MEVLMRTSVRVLPALTGLLAPVLLIAQGPAPQTATPQPPYIAASAVGESRITPDRAVVRVAVDSRNESAAAAGADVRTKQERVIGAVKAAGIASPQIRTLGYNVSAEYAMPDKGKPPKITGYRASNTVQVEVRNLDIVGKVIDAVLEAGATNIGSVSLYASNTDSARRAAVNSAVAKARGEAEAAASAAGGTLGTLIELTIDPIGLPRPLLENVVVTSGAVALSSDGSRMPMSFPTPAPTAIEAGESLVVAVVRARWQFTSGGR
jgi:uncharacterized protein